MSVTCLIPEDYRPILDDIKTEKAIKQIKDHFQPHLSKSLNLKRVTAPLFVEAGTGINDELTGVERPISFQVKSMKNTTGEIVQSLAKWKRLKLAGLGLKAGEGIYTDMNAIRPDETLDSLHSLYVDQWDWEKVISSKDRNLDFLRKEVRKIYGAMKKTESYIHELYPPIKPCLPEDIRFIHASELQERYPDLAPAEREHAICSEFGAVFLIGIGAPLGNGKPHDRRAPDYDDWTTQTELGPGLNGDILVWYPLLRIAFEISSMGIRVDPSALEKQLKITGTTAKKKLFFHKKLLSGDLPLCIGGGIGQSRLCMLFLKKAHIGEVQSSLWPEEMREECRKANIHLL